jgi:hypothetical protein
LPTTSAFANHAFVLFEDPELVGLLVDEELRVADVLELHPPHHRRATVSMCLSLMFTPCSR